MTRAPSQRYRPPRRIASSCSRPFGERACCTKRARASKKSGANAARASNPDTVALHVAAEHRLPNRLLEARDMRLEEVVRVTAKYSSNTERNRGDQLPGNGIA